jgi:hypothetical protein
VEFYEFDKFDVDSTQRTSRQSRGRLRLRFELHQEQGECFAERFDARLLLGVSERSVRLERLVCLGHGDLVRQDDDTDVAEDRPEVDQPS